MRRVGWILLLVFAIALLVCCGAKNVEYAMPRLDEPLVLPGDHASHPDFKTEWWYFTGHLESDDGKRFGFELVFFRRRTEQDTLWGYPIRRLANPMYMSNFAVTDIENDEFTYDMRVGREDDFTGYASTDYLFVKVDRWRVEEAWPDIHIFAETNKKDGYTLDLVLTPKKPAVVHGEGGVSRKCKEGNSSYYISFTRMEARGILERGCEAFRVSGVAWHDHEIMSTGLGECLKGWKWFSIMLDDDTEIMLFHTLRKDGSVDPFSSGTIVFPDGKYEHFYVDSFDVEDLDFWYSKRDKANYPVKWRVRVPKYGVDLTITAVKNDQELYFKGFPVAYWEGACTVGGTHAGEPVSGHAYVEMTGYGKKEVRI